MANAERRRQTGPESPKRTSTVNMAMLLVPQTAAAFPEGALRFRAACSSSFALSLVSLKHRVAFCFR